MLCLDRLRPTSNASGKRRRLAWKAKPATLESFVQIVNPDRNTSAIQKSANIPAGISKSQSDTLINGTMLSGMGAG